MTEGSSIPVLGNQVNNLKDISTLEMSLMDANLNKVSDLLGQPDNKGQAPNGSVGHYIYYDRVTENNSIKNLVIYWTYNRYYDSFKSIKKVVAVKDGDYVDLGYYGRVFVKKPTGFGGEFKNVDVKIIDANKQFNEIDTIKQAPVRMQHNQAQVSVYTGHNNANIALIKYVSFAVNGVNFIESYYFNDEKLTAVIKEDSQHTLMTQIYYVANDKVIKYTRDGKEFNCDECDFDEFSLPYTLLREYKRRDNVH